VRVCTANQQQAEDDLHLLSQLYSQPELSTVSLAAAALLLSVDFLWPPTASVSHARSLTSRLHGNVSSNVTNYRNSLSGSAVAK
jgi:hypothetical protein